MTFFELKQQTISKLAEMKNELSQVNQVTKEQIKFIAADWYAVEDRFALCGGFGWRWLKLEWRVFKLQLKEGLGADWRDAL